MIDGIWWLVILIGVVVGLWLLAKSRGAKSSEQKSDGSARKQPVNDALQKTVTLYQKYFPDYRVTRKAKHLLVSKQHKKVAMITIDKNLVAGQRRLGEVPVINFHQVPNRDLLTVTLEDLEITRH